MSLRLTATAIKSFFQYRCDRQVRYAMLASKERRSLTILDTVLLVLIFIAYLWRVRHADRTSAADDADDADAEAGDANADDDGDDDEAEQMGSIAHGALFSAMVRNGCLFFRPRDSPH